MALNYNGATDPSQGYGSYYIDQARQQIAKNYGYPTNDIISANYEGADMYGFPTNGSEPISYGQSNYYQGSQFPVDYNNYANYQQSTKS